MKNYFIIVAILLFSGGSMSQERTAYGILNNIRTKEPVQNALVKVSGADREVYTDSLGNFKIDIPKGSHRLLVSHDDYLTEDWWLKAPYWKKPMTLGLRDSIWEINDKARNKEKIFTSQYEFDQCYRKKLNKTNINKEYSVLFVLTKSGDTIEFNKNNPGRILDTGVFGLSQKYLPFGTVDSIQFNTKALESVWKNGIKYQFIAQDPTGYLCYQPDEVNIPLSEIDMIKVRTVDNKKSAGITMIVVGGMAGMAGIAVIVYSLNHMFESF